MGEHLALFVVLKLFTNMVLETVLYAGAAGVSQVALLVLRSPCGPGCGYRSACLMPTPLTVCLVVLGKHVPGSLVHIGTLMADSAGARAQVAAIYQRLLARDPSEAADLIDRHVKTEPRGSGV